MAITIICKKGSSDVRRYARRAPANTPIGMEQHELQQFAENAETHAKLKRARGSSKRRESDVERIGTMPSSMYFDLKRKGAKFNAKTLREMGALYPTVDE